MFLVCFIALCSFQLFKKIIFHDSRSVLLVLGSENYLGHNKNVHIIDVRIRKVDHMVKCFDQNCYLKWIN